MRADLWFGKQHWIMDSDLKTVTLFDGVVIQQCSFKQFEEILKSRLSKLESEK